jgi:tRNA nucleotidyltransferase (CCA-adding enzyme)
LPTVEDSSIKLDLHRRDFTINTLALCLNPDRWGELLDFYGGLNDLHQGIIRVLHSLSFVDDPTRILRAVRYEQRFRFVIEPRTLELLLDAVELLDRVTPARVRHELERILQEERPEEALARLSDLGVLRRLHADLVVDDWVRRRYSDLRTARHESAPDSVLTREPLDRLYFGVLVYRLDEAVHMTLTTRLGLRAETQRLMQGLRRMAAAEAELDSPDLPPSRVVAILDAIEPAALALAPVLMAERPRVLERLSMYARTWKDIHPILDGHDLADIGVARGPLYGELLTRLRAARLDGMVSTREDEIAWVRRYLATGHD